MRGDSESIDPDTQIEGLTLRNQMKLKVSQVKWFTMNFLLLFSALQCYFIAVFTFYTPESTIL